MKSDNYSAGHSPFETRTKVFEHWNNPLHLITGSLDNVFTVYLYDHYNDVIKDNSEYNFKVNSEINIRTEDQLIKLDRNDGKGRVSVSIADILTGGTGNPDYRMPEQDVVFNEYTQTDWWRTEIPRADYYQYDHLGNTRMVFTKEDGYWVDNDDDSKNNTIDNDPTNGDYHFLFVADYYPYGKTLRKYMAGKEEKYQSTFYVEQCEIPIFLGKRDLESGFDFRGARYYDSDVARFLSTDPLAADYMAWSTYCYVLCNPIMLIDPDGRSAEPPPNNLGLPQLSVVHHHSAVMTSTETVKGAIKENGTATEIKGSGKYQRQLTYYWAPKGTEIIDSKGRSMGATKTDSYYVYTKRLKIEEKFSVGFGGAKSNKITDTTAAIKNLESAVDIYSYIINDNNTFNVELTLKVRWAKGENTNFVKNLVRQALEQGLELVIEYESEDVASGDKYVIGVSSQEGVFVQDEKPVIINEEDDKD